MKKRPDEHKLQNHRVGADGPFTPTTSAHPLKDRPERATPTALRKLSEENPADVTLSMNAAKAKVINQLLETGLFGHTAAGCCTRLLDQKLFEVAQLLNLRVS